jgi:predicted phosphodiesterase
MRIFAISDLHTDFEANWQELLQCSQTLYSDDLLIVAGDISDRIEVIAKTLKYLNGIFRNVCYTPGNHEMWSRRESKTSVSKLGEILHFCDTAGIHTKPQQFDDVWVVPMFSWYQTKDLSAAVSKDEMLLLWSDLYFCVWNEIDGCVSDYMADLNKNEISKVSGDRVISFSHFLPRKELLPDLNRIRFKALEYVSVCPQLLPQIQAIGSKIHIFGHTHIHCDVIIDNIRFVQNSFGYPRERRSRNNQFFKLIYDSNDSRNTKEFEPH